MAACSEILAAHAESPERCLSWLLWNSFCSIHFDTGVLDDLRPAGQLDLQESIELIDAAGRRFATHGGDTRFDFGVFEHTVDFAVELLRDGGRHTRRAK